MRVAFDRHRFVDERAPEWSELERLLQDVDARGLKTLGIDGARRLGELYRSVSSDLIRARTESMTPLVVDYLNSLVARAYVSIYGRRRASYGRRIAAFVWREYPRLVRREWLAVSMAAIVSMLGAGFGAIVVALDPSAAALVVPGDHQNRTPGERVSHDEQEARAPELNTAAAFASFLFTHNIRVTFLVFALGITAGIGTLAVLFMNGVQLGALAVQYHLSNQGLFFWAWILPHGIPELTAVFVAGGAGFVLARGLLLPGRRSRRQSLMAEAKTAVGLVLGSMPVLVVAGLVEGSISQVHAPVVPYEVKLAVAAAVGIALYTYLLRGGREPRASSSQ